MQTAGSAGLGQKVAGDEPTARRADDTPQRAAARRLVLRSVLPGDHGVLELSSGRLTLGRGEACSLRLSDAGVSRLHAEIERRGPVTSIRDLGSTNGTFVDGSRAEHVRIAPGSVLRLGEWLGMVEEHDADDPGPFHFRELAAGVWGGALLARVLAPAVRAATSSLPIVLVGRTGSGKERFARAVHACGHADRPFHAVNCAALPPALAEAELFGYRRGAFTGAERAHEGHLRAAGAGTLFLDEIAELPLALQAKLLRALDTGEFTPLGETERFRFQARVVAACQVPPAELVAGGTFREDLAARLGGLVVTLPDVHSRRGDVPSLFAAFLAWHSAGTAPPVSAGLYERLCLWAWPANVREIELLARQMLAVHGLEPVLRRSHLPHALREPAPAPTPLRVVAGDPVEAFSLALRGSRGNVKQAAKAAGISRQRAYRLIHVNGLGGVVGACREQGGKRANGADE